MHKDLQSLKRVTLTAITAVAVAAALVPAGPASAGNGKGNGAGHGKPSEEVLLLKRGSKKNRIEHSGEASGAVASSLRHLNGPAHASEVALERANERSKIGQARLYRDAALAEAQTETELGDQRERLADLGSERTVETIQAEIDALDPVADADRIAALEQEKAGARTDAEVGAEINSVLAGIEALESTQFEQQSASGEAFDNLTGGRTLTDDAVSVIRSALGLD